MSKCNGYKKEAHNVRVSEISLYLGERLIVLSVSKVSWQSTFNSMQLEFGESKENFELLRHHRLQSRQAATTVSGTSTVSTSVNYPAAPTFTPADHSATANINKQYLDTSILPPDTSFGQLTVSGPKMYAKPSHSSIECS